MWLTGSRARSKHRPDSDVDVLVTKLELQQFPRELAYEYGGAVDLWVMDGDQCKPAFRDWPNMESLPELMVETNVASVRDMNDAALRCVTYGPEYNHIVIHIKGATRRIVFTDNGLVFWICGGTVSGVEVDGIMETACEMPNDPRGELRDPQAMIHIHERLGFHVIDYRVGRVEMVRGSTHRGAE